MIDTRKPRTAFITGGMSGLGKALASEYISRGASVAIFDMAINDEVLQELQAAASNSGQQVQAYVVSVTEAEALNEAVGKAVAAVGKPELAINCAGIQRADPFDVQSQADFELVVQVNLFGSRNFAAAVVPHMESGARLALVASMAGFTANYSYAAYSASKFSVIGLGRVLRLELKPKGIEVSMICPPEVDTPMVTEEAKNMHPVSRTLKDLAGTLDIDTAISGILSGLDAGKLIIVPGLKAKITYFTNRYLPDFVMNGVVDRIVVSVLNKMEKK
jgi:NAD(P)-dependent dehydrogenase (short-subunit alcohol dehydrogenase family)